MEKESKKRLVIIKYLYNKSDVVFMKTLLRYLFGKKRDLVRKELVIGKIAFGVWH